MLLFILSIFLENLITSDGLYTHIFPCLFLSYFTKMKIRDFFFKKPSGIYKNKNSSKRGKCSQLLEVETDGWVVTDLANTRKQNPTLAVGNPRQA